MKNLSKICDAADWFDPAIVEIIHNHLQEPPRFHRKQWEFAIIFLALQRYGLLSVEKKGLSLGGGNERVLYAIAREIDKLIVTDLYDDNTDWATARTSDPQQFIDDHMPFPVAKGKIEALRMDMRQLDFQDNSFDFCYSSCAIEHIGSDRDFVNHFNEVARVLKPDGYYVLTTELNFGGATVRDENNYIFAAEHLSNLLESSNLAAVVQPQVQLTRHQANSPFPPNFAAMADSPDNSLHQFFSKSFPHIILMRGKVPFTSVSLILQPRPEKVAPAKLIFNGIESSATWLRQEVQTTAQIIKHCTLSLATGRPPVPHYNGDHREFLLEPDPADGNLLFHSEYHWFGSGSRYLLLQLSPAGQLPAGSLTIQLKVHRYATMRSEVIETVYDTRVTFGGDRPWQQQIQYETSEDYCYAVLARVISGEGRLKSIELLSQTQPLIAVKSEK